MPAISTQLPITIAAADVIGDDSINSRMVVWKPVPSPPQAYKTMEEITIQAVSNLVFIIFFDKHPSMVLAP